MTTFFKDIQYKIKAEWEPAYIDYHKLNRLLEIFKIISITYRYITHHDEQQITQTDELTKQQVDNLEVIGRHIQKIFLQQKRKTDAFIQYKMYELYSSWSVVQQTVNNLSTINFKEHAYNDKRKNIKQAVQIIYQNTNFLIQFMEINHRIIQQIEFDVNQYVKTFYDWNDYSYTFFSQRNNFQHFLEFVNQFYSEQFCSIYNQNQLDLLAINKTKQSKPKDYFLMGLFVGFALLLLIMMIASFILDIYEPISWSSSAESFKYVFPMFRGISLFILYMWGLSWNVWGYTNFGVNYRLIFKMGTHYSTYIQIMKRAGFFTVLLLIMVILYLVGYQYSNQTHQRVPIEYAPLVVYFIFFSYIFFPAQDVFNPKGRQYFYTILMNVLLSPFIKITFIIVFVTGQFLSFVVPLKDLAYTICYYSSDLSTKQVKECLAYNTVQGVLIGYVVAIIPLCFRMLQCFNQARQSSGKFFGHIQMWNFLKNLASFITSTLSFLNKFHPQLLTAYICSSVISTLAAYYWDLKYSWGFFEKGAKYKFVKNTLSYKKPIFYYVAIFSNLLLRCAWTLTMSSFIVASIQSVFLTFITSLLQIFRRCIWNFFRVQREHLANCKDFRTTQSISNILQSDPLKGGIKGSVQNNDYHNMLVDFSHRLTNYRQTNIRVFQQQSKTMNLINSTTPEMVSNALTSFKRLIKKQQQSSIEYLQSMTQLYNSVQKYQIILARKNLKYRQNN